MEPSFAADRRAHRLIQLGGSYRPFPRTAAERARTSDPRRTIEERYPSRQHYLGLIAEASQAMVEQRLLMPEDVVRHLETQGCRLLRDRGKHSVYVNPANNQTSAVPRHRDLNDFLARKICRDLGIPQP